MMHRTFIERHVVALDLSTRVTREGHIVHENIDITAGSRELAVNEFEYK